MDQKLMRAKRKGQFRVEKIIISWIHSFQSLAFSGETQLHQLNINKRYEAKSEHMREALPIYNPKHWLGEGFWLNKG